MERMAILIALWLRLCYSYWILMQLWSPSEQEATVAELRSHSRSHNHRLWSMSMMWLLPPRVKDISWHLEHVSSSETWARIFWELLLQSWEIRKVRRAYHTRRSEVELGLNTYIKEDRAGEYILCNFNGPLYLYAEGPPATERRSGTLSGGVMPSKLHTDPTKTQPQGRALRVGQRKKCEECCEASRPPGSGDDIST